MFLNTKSTQYSCIQTSLKPCKAELYSIFSSIQETSKTSKIFTTELNGHFFIIFYFVLFIHFFFVILKFRCLGLYLLNMTESKQGMHL